MLPYLTPREQERAGLIERECPLCRRSPCRCEIEPECEQDMDDSLGTGEYCEVDDE